MAYVCDQPTDTGCTAWVSLDDPAALAELGVTAGDIATVAGQTAAGILLMWVMGLVVGHVVALVKLSMED